MKDFVVMADGTRLRNVHTGDQCAGQHCVIHNPSNHHMATWPHSWNDQLVSMWRECDHGMSHPDPDDLAFKRRSLGDFEAANQSLHICDGCCQPPAVFVCGNDTIDRLAEDPLVTEALELPPQVGE